MKVQGLRFDTKNGAIREISDQDIYFLSSDMIQEDLDYCRDAGYGNNTIKAVLSHVMNSSFCFSVEDVDGKLVFTFGFLPSEEEGVCTMWAFSTNQLFKIKNPVVSMDFLSNVNEILDFMNNIYPVIKASINKNNKNGRRRLKFAGFKLYSLEGEIASYLRS